MPMLGELLHKLGPYVHRLQPRTLRWRLVSAAAGFSILGVAAMFVAVHFAAVAQFDRFAEENARRQLSAFRTFIAMEQDDVAERAAEMARASGRPWVGKGSDVASAEWMAGRVQAAGLTSFVRTDTSGKTVALAGPPAEMTALTSLAGRASVVGTAGLVWAGDRPLIVACLPISSPDGSPLGRLLVGRPLSTAVEKRFAPLTDGLVVGFSAPSPTPASLTPGIAGFARGRIEIKDGVAHSTVELPGVASPVAGLAVLDLRETRRQDALAVADRAALVATLLVGGLGAFFGLGLAAAVQSPIDRTRRHLREQGPLALQGLPCEPVGVRPETTSEFRELASEVDGLLAALGRRQAELVEATAEARTAQASLRAALDGSPEGKLLVENEVIVLVNRAAADMLGFPVDELVGLRAFDLPRLIPAFREDGERIEAAAAAWLGSGKALVVRVRPGEERERWVEVKETDLGPEASRMLVSLRDITEERHLDAMREEIFSIVSHDLRAPLTVVQGYLDILERPLEEAARRRALESARHNAVKMAGLLDDLLDATTADRLLAPKNVQPLDLGDVAREVASSAEPMAMGHRIEVVAKAPAMVSGEERRLRQALMNLVTNAIKYSPEDTAVKIRVSTVGKHALLAVEDEGPGIPAESRESVFQRYGRLASTAEGKPGLGLGLYIVRVIAENHGGRARVEDAPGGGARFVIVLPAVRDEA
ncbi:MAG TPA: ATP-binding protein [Coriobacteriia bacterium]|jgi:PAS domain S-box-containing protein